MNAQARVSHSPDPQARPRDLGFWLAVFGVSLSRCLDFQDLGFRASGFWQLGRDIWALIVRLAFRGVFCCRDYKGMLLGIHVNSGWAVWQDGW